MEQFPNSVSWNNFFLDLAAAKLYEAWDFSNDFYISRVKSLYRMLYSPKLPMESHQISRTLLFSPKSTASVLNCLNLSEISPKRDLCPLTLPVVMFRIDMRWDRHKKCPWPKFLGVPCLQTASFPMDSEFLNSGLQQLW